MNKNDYLERCFLNLKIKEIGAIKISSGELLVADVFGSFQAVPFTTKFPIGDFPVELAILEHSENKIEHIALARLKFTEETPVEWQLATTKGSSLLGISLFSGFSVDSGMTSIMDLSVREEFKKETIRQNGFDYLVDILSDKASESWVSHVMNYELGNIFMFTSGVGDGHYNAYTGIDRNKKICRLVIDFGLVK